MHDDKRAGFTIIEVAVVVGIFCILLSVMYSTVRQIHKQALTISCRMHMQQISRGFSLYALDYDGLLPHSDRDSDSGTNYCWFDVLDDYLFVQNLHCVKQCPQWSGYTSGTTMDEHSLKMNGALCNKERRRFAYKNGENGRWYWPNTWYIPDKSRTILLVDGIMTEPYNRHTDTRIHEPYRDISTRHNGTNLLFIDGTSVFVPENAERNSIDYDKFIWEPFR